MEELEIENEKLRMMIINNIKNKNNNNALILDLIKDIKQLTSRIDKLENNCLQIIDVLEQKNNTGGNNHVSNSSAVPRKA
jgi:hypothetical protein